MTPFRLVLIAFSLVFVGIVAYRLVNGLQMTNLTDAWPWGLWIFIDVKLGVALAAGSCRAIARLGPVTINWRIISLSS